MALSLVCQMFREAAFACLGKCPPAEGFAGFQEVLCRHQRIEYAGVMPVLHGWRQRQIDRQRITARELRRLQNANGTQIGSDGFADVGQVFKTC